MVKKSGSVVKHTSWLVLIIEMLERELVYLWYYFSIQVEQIFNYWLLGIILGSVISVYGKERIHKLLLSMQQKKLNALIVIPASLLGIASPLCMYGTIPLAAAFSQKGMKDDCLAAFMMSSILLNPQLIIYSAALGKTMLFIRVALCFVCGIIAGLCVHYFYREKVFFNFSEFVEPPNRDTDPNMLLRLLKNIWRNIKATGGYFLLGIILAVLFQRYISGSDFAVFFGKQNSFGVLMAATIGVPLYVCGGGMVPLLAEWLNSGMSFGAASAFMIMGAATKITNLGAVKIILGLKHFIVYLLFVMTFSLVMGVLINIFV